MLRDEAQFNRDGVNNKNNSHVWGDENPHAIVESKFQQRFSVNVVCAVLDDQLIGPFILEGRLAGETYLRFLQEELPQRLEDVPLDKRSPMYFQHDGAPPHSSRGVTNFLNYRFPGRTWRSTPFASQVSRFKPTGLLCMGMDEGTGLQCESGNARCIAQSQSGRR